MFFDRLKQEEEHKRKRLYDNVNIFSVRPLVTRFSLKK